jgi:hypothetical protein
MSDNRKIQGSSKQQDDTSKQQHFLFILRRLLALSFSEFNFNWQAYRQAQAQAYVLWVGRTLHQLVCQKEAFLAIRNSN